MVGMVIAPSPTEFADKVLTYDTVGILAGESWVRQKEVVLKWRNKAFRCWFQEEESDWVPGWIDSPTRKSFPVVFHGTSDEESEESPVQNEDEWPITGETSDLGCMGKGEAEVGISSTPIPDLNSQMSYTQSEEGRDLELGEIVPDLCGPDGADKSSQGQQYVLSEVEATIKMGK
ncbi:hypothetical protein L1987_46826 [Smallanthus sonchifolius]|uniref:Uncharacterized protein n=1 Tax=Smallanthus sonchifolius TaxID=185202 RepID=A0ACB9G1W9_9ASTR|nr:hypothetical protein L1987_46826 [Smallanthus sonchifolius]